MYIVSSFKLIFKWLNLVNGSGSREFHSLCQKYSMGDLKDESKLSCFSESITDLVHRNERAKLSDRQKTGRHMG